MAQPTAGGAEPWCAGEVKRLPKPPPSTVNPDTGGLRHADVHLNAYTSGDQEGEAERVAVDLERDADSVGYGEEHRLIVEVGREARHLQPHRDDGRILLRGEPDVPSREEEGAALNIEEIFEQDKQEVFLILKPQEQMAIVQGAKEEVLPKLKPLG